MKMNKIALKKSVSVKSSDVMQAPTWGECSLPETDQTELLHYKPATGNAPDLQITHKISDWIANKL